MVERLRISVSRIFVALVAILVLVSASRWETRLPIVASILFFSGLLAAAVATVGRLWCTLYIAGYKTKSLIRVGPYSVCRNPLYFSALSAQWASARPRKP
jgi:protein-S-isoprenylcysteine O-methyltransferase Ste14